MRNEIRITAIFLLLISALIFIHYRDERELEEFKFQQQELDEQINDLIHKNYLLEDSLMLKERELTHLENLLEAEEKTITHLKQEQHEAIDHIDTYNGDALFDFFASIDTTGSNL